MSNDANVMTENLSVTSNVVALTVKTLSKISDQSSVEISNGTRSILVTRILQRLAIQLRNKDIEG